MAILVTGGAGYVGSHLVAALAQMGDVVVLVRAGTRFRCELPSSCRVCSFDSYSEILDIFSKFSIQGVVHLAAHICVDHELADISALVDSNILFGTYLLEASRKFNVKWFINTGTFWQHYYSDSYCPVNLYAASKQAFMLIAPYYTETSCLVFVTLKLNDTFGPKDWRKKIFNLWYMAAITGETLDMTGGEQLIDISYIEDVVASYIQLIALLNSPNSQDNLQEYQLKEFVVSNSEKLTLKELAALFQVVIDKPLAIRWGAKPYRSREVMIPYSSGVSVPGYRQRFTLGEAMQKTVEGLKNDG